MSSYKEYESLEEYNSERNQALIVMDTNWFYGLLVANGHKDPNPEVVLAAMHKARYHILAIPKALRHESGRWLRERGYSDLHGMDLLPDGQLPE